MLYNIKICLKDFPFDIEDKTIYFSPTAKMARRIEVLIKNSKFDSGSATLAISHTPSIPMGKQLMEGVRTQLDRGDLGETNLVTSSMKRIMRRLNAELFEGSTPSDTGSYIRVYERDPYFISSKMISVNNVQYQKDAEFPYPYITWDKTDTVIEDASNALIYVDGLLMYRTGTALRELECVVDRCQQIFTSIQLMGVANLKYPKGDTKC